MPFCPAAITRSADAMPLAIAPVYSGYLTPYCSMNAAEPEPSIDHGTARTRPVAAARQVHHNVALRVDQRAPEARRVA